VRDLLAGGSIHHNLGRYAAPLTTSFLPVVLLYNFALALLLQQFYASFPGITMTKLNSTTQFYLEHHLYAYCN